MDKRIGHEAAWAAGCATWGGVQRRSCVPRDETLDADVHQRQEGNMPQQLHLQPGYTVDWRTLPWVTLADDLTLGAVCESLERMEPGQRAALEVILGYPWRRGSTIADARYRSTPTRAGLLEIVSGAAVLCLAHRGTPLADVDQARRRSRHGIPGRGVPAGDTGGEGLCAL